MDENISILVVDDEDRIRRLLRMYLERENYKVEEARDGYEALELALNNDYHTILLDIMMPEMDGIDVCKALRKVKDTPVIMLTAKGEEANRVQGYEVGADDYIVKPFSPREVVLRVKAVVRRAATAGMSRHTPPPKDVLVDPHADVERDAHRVSADGNEVNLTPQGYARLCCLAK